MRASIEQQQNIALRLGEALAIFALFTLCVDWSMRQILRRTMTATSKAPLSTSRRRQQLVSDDGEDRDADAHEKFVP
jgi:hypothetical protein